MPCFRLDGEDLLLWLRVQPRSSRDGFGEVLEDAIKLRITAPPVDGKANAHLVSWLSRQFGVSKSAVIVESGDTARRKRVRIKSPCKLPAALRSTGVTIS